MKITSASSGAVSTREYEQLSILLVFACDEYEHDNLPNLRCSVRDGQLVVDTFSRFGFDKVVALFNKDVTKASIENELSKLMETHSIRTEEGRIENRIGRLYVMFAGHGTPDKTADDGTSFFCPHDFDPKRYTFLCLPDPRVPDRVHPRFRRA